jgi:arsenate reductase
MAEGWARALKTDSLDAYSAGTSPHGLNPMAVRAMAEAGVDISDHTSKRPEDIEGTFDVVVTVCDAAHESCPVMPGTRVVHVGFDDPPRLAKGAASDDEAMGHYRRVRDQIRTFVESLPDSVFPPKERSMSTIKVFDPPMCCSTGACGPDPDAKLAQFAADLAWFAAQGVRVERYSLSQQPDMFLKHAAVLQAVNAGSTKALPIVMVDDSVISERGYPTRDQLAAKVGPVPAGASAPTGRSGGCGCGPKGCC